MRATTTGNERIRAGIPRGWHAGSHDNAVRDLRTEVLPVLADLQVAIAAPRDRLGEILGAIVRRRKRPESA
jgi:hypothetical protein